MITDNLTLLKQYAQDGSEDAFRELVTRHLGAVYSAARRQVGEALAADVTQAVFVVLARKAGKLGSRTILTAWLLTTTRLVARATLRRESRRQRREQEAAAMPPDYERVETQFAWEQIAPLLDDALAVRSQEKKALSRDFLTDTSIQTVLSWNNPARQTRIRLSASEPRSDMNGIRGSFSRGAWGPVSIGLVMASLFIALRVPAAEPTPVASADSYHFDQTISREVLENYLSRAITMEGLLNGRGNLDDNIRMLRSVGAKFIGRSFCLWGGEANLLSNLERAKEQLPKVHAADPDMILQACIFEIVTTQVEQVPVPDWAFTALGRPVEKRNFRYADMLYPSGRFKDHWRSGQSVPDVSRPETKLWFYFLGASFIDVGCEAIHFGQTELMNGNDRGLDNYSQVLGLIRTYAAAHARRHMVLCDSHVPSGGLVRNGQLLMDFHSFPLRIMEVPDKPQEAILKVGFSDGLYGRSKGGKTFSGWTCDHLPYLVEIDNWGASRQPGQAKAGGIWVWGYDEITWFAHQSQEYRSNWLRYARNWVRQTDPNGHLEMPGSRTVRSPLDNLHWYYANNPSSAVPDGFGDEEAIRAIWAADSTRR